MNRTIFDFDYSQKFEIGKKYRLISMDAADHRYGNSEYDYFSECLFEFCGYAFRVLDARFVSDTIIFAYGATFIASNPLT